MFTSKRDIMGSLVNHRITTVLGWFVVVVVVTLNIYLLWETILDNKSQVLYSNEHWYLFD